MRAPLSWLRDYAPLAADVGDLASTLSSLGLVVEGVEQVGEGLDDVVVARVLEIRAIPGADNIRVVDVDAGGEPTEIVCGARNFKVGDLVPLAPVGAVLPGDFRITSRKMRGQVSNGMLCSPEELRLPVPAGAADGLLTLPDDLAEPGTRLVDALGLETDVVFDIDISPNRPDALCMAGIARDLAAALGEQWSWPSNPAAPEIDGSLGTARIVVESGDLCPRFTGTIIEGAPEGHSPAWMARRLTLAGMRPIGAVVDVSNYVMLDVGQPNHAYDLDRLGGGGILVRRGRQGEVLETLDGVERKLEESDCVICDADGNAVGVGGIMGGASAEIARGTRRVLLEAAWFAPMAIAQTGRRLGLHSEARIRFERGVDPEVAQRAVERFVGLLSVLEGGASVRRGATVDVRDPSLPAAATAQLRTARVNSILGTSLDDTDVSRLLTPLGFDTHASEPGLHAVSVPTWRPETDREIDLIEEVARMWGYGRIDRTVPGGIRVSSGLTPYQRERRRVRDIMAAAGYHEAWTTTFLGPGDLESAGLDGAAVEVANPLDRSESILRTSLLPGLLKAVRFNAERQEPGVCLFEIGHVFFLPSGDAVLPDEVERLAAIAAIDEGAVVATTRTWRYLADGLRLERVALQAASPDGLHPTRAARILGLGGQALGCLGEVDPDVVLAYGLTGRVGYLEISLEGLLAEPRLSKAARDVSRFPASDVDLAFIVSDDVPAAALEATLVDSAGSWLESVVLFDVYRGAQVGEGRRSLAFRLRWRAPDKTLSDEEIAALRSGCIDAVVAAHGAELRA